MNDDDFCLDCSVQGECCYWFVIVDNQHIKTTTPCMFLDLKTKLCSVYKNRFKLNPYCQTSKQAKKQGLLPLNCKHLTN